MFRIICGTAAAALIFVSAQAQEKTARIVNTFVSRADRPSRICIDDPRSGAPHTRTVRPGSLASSTAGNRSRPCPHGAHVPPRRVARAQMSTT